MCRRGLNYERARQHQCLASGKKYIMYPGHRVRRRYDFAYLTNVMTPTFAMSSSNNFHVSVSISFWRMVSGSGGGAAGHSGGNSSSSRRVFWRLDNRLLCRVEPPSSPVESCFENIDPLRVVPAFPIELCTMRTISM